MKLHPSDTSALIELWSSLKSYVPAKDQRACADQYVATIAELELVDFAVSRSDLYGTCGIFDKALNEYYEDHYGEDELNDDDWDE